MVMGLSLLMVALAVGLLIVVFALWFVVLGILGNSRAPPLGVPHVGVSLPLPTFGRVLPLVLRLWSLLPAAVAVGIHMA